MLGNLKNLTFSALKLSPVINLSSEECCLDSILLNIIRNRWSEILFQVLLKQQRATIKEKQ